MNTTFQEKSTWISMLATAAVATWFFSVSIPLIFLEELAGREALRAFTGLGIAAVAMLVVLQVVGHILAAVISKPEDEDERDRSIGLRSDQVGGIVLYIGVISTIGHILAAGFLDQPSIVALASPFGILNLLVGSMVVAEICACLTRIWLYRRGA
jgi:hypothetical protein